MATIIHTQGLSISSELRAHMARRFTFALYRFENRIALTEVFFKEPGEERRGKVSSLVVKIRLAGKGEVVVEAGDPDPYAAIALAARRCKRAVKRALKQPLEQRRAGMHRLRKVPANRVAAEPG